LNFSQRKRSQFSSNITCHTCGFPGHKIKDCIAKRHVNGQMLPPRTQPSGTVTSSNNNAFSTSNNNHTPFTKKETTTTSTVNTGSSVGKPSAFVHSSSHQSQFPSSINKRISSISSSIGKGDSCEESNEDHEIVQYTRVGAIRHRLESKDDCIMVPLLI